MLLCIYKFEKGKAIIVLIVEKRMNNAKISEKQMEILNFIKSEILRIGYPPSVREICNAVKLKSTSSVHAHLGALEKQGYIRRDATKPRAIEILDDDFNLTGRNIRNVPVVGSVAAGAPILAYENIVDYFPIPSEYLPCEDVFMLCVKGTSMVNAGILDGDKVLVKKQETADDGDIVVALINDSATVKRLYRENGYIRLQPENDFMEPIIVTEANVIGKVIGVFRMFK